VWQGKLEELWALPHPGVPSQLIVMLYAISGYRSSPIPYYQTSNPPPGTPPLVDSLPAVGVGLDPILVTDGLVPADQYLKVNLTMWNESGLIYWFDFVANEEITTNTYGFRILDPIWEYPVGALGSGESTYARGIQDVTLQLNIRSLPLNQ